MLDIILIIIFSIQLNKYCKEKNLKPFFWIYRYISLIISFDIVIAIIAYKKYGMQLQNDMPKLMVIELISLSIIVGLFFLMKRNIKNTISISDDKPDDTPPKDLSYFR
jgi:hypothetical protein